MTASIDITGPGSAETTQVIRRDPAPDETGQLTRDDLIRLASTRAAIRAAASPTMLVPVIVPRTSSFLGHVLPGIEDQERRTEQRLRRQDRRRKTRWVIGSMLAFLIVGVGIGTLSYYTSSMDRIVNTVLDLSPF